MQLQKFLTLVDEIIRENISDLHITPNDYPYIRDKIGDIIPVESFWKLGQDDINDICTLLLSRDFTEKSIDLSFEYKETRFRVNISRVLRWVTLAFRTIPNTIPQPDEILLPESLLKLTTKDKWIILITGPTGSGKSTTMAAMLDYINANTKKHIITLEDPIEFVHKNKKSLVHQRELWKQFDSFPDGIRSILREDPDIIVIGEMRDLATIEAAITLAETGHLVFSTLHTNDTVQTIERIIQSFPADKQNQIRMQFWLAMKLILSQILLPRKDNSWRIVAREVMMNTDSIRNLIIRGSTQQMYTVLETSKQDGMILMDDALINLFRKWVISLETVKNSIRDFTRAQSLDSGV
jgi:twitching motility protein PilT